MDELGINLRVFKATYPQLRCELACRFSVPEYACSVSNFFSTTGRMVARRATGSGLGIPSPESPRRLNRPIYGGVAMPTKSASAATVRFDGSNRDDSVYTEAMLVATRFWTTATTGGNNPETLRYST